jgi:hypothetical protein
MIASLDAQHKYPVEHPLSPPSVLHPLHLFLEASHSANGPSRSIVVRYTYTTLSRVTRLLRGASLFLLVFLTFSSPVISLLCRILLVPADSHRNVVLKMEIWRNDVRGIVAARIKGGGAFVQVCWWCYTCCVVCCVVLGVAGKTSLPLFDIYRGVDSRRLRRNPRTGIRFENKQCADHRWW